MGLNMQLKPKPKALTGKSMPSFGIIPRSPVGLGDRPRALTSPILGHMQPVRLNFPAPLPHWALKMCINQVPVAEQQPLLTAALPAPEDITRNSTLWTAVWNILCAMIGAGMLGMPGTLAGTSWYGLVVMVLGCGVMHFTGQCMAYCSLKDPSLMTYRDLGAKAFGWWGQMLVLVLQVCDTTRPALQGIAAYFAGGRRCRWSTTTSTWQIAKWRQW